MFDSLRDRVVNIIAACRQGLNAICMVLLVIAEVEDDTVHAEGLETTVGVFELVFLLLGKDLESVSLTFASLSSS